MSRNVEVIKPWRYSRHGFDSNFADVGEKLAVSAELAEIGVGSGNVKYTDGKKAKAVPETTEEAAAKKAAATAKKAMAAAENKMAKPADNKDA
jgi:hypothetical protein